MPSSDRKVSSLQLRLHMGILCIQKVDGHTISNIGENTFLGKHEDMRKIIIDLIKNHFEANSSKKRILIKIKQENL